MTRPKSPRQREREAVVTAWLAEQAKKGKLGRARVGGPARVGDTPLWLRAAVSREGDFLVTRCCIVADADVHPFEVRVDMRKLAGTLQKMHALGHLKMPAGGDTVAGFGSFLKKAARAITKNAVTRAVGGVVKKVVSHPIVQIANPMAAVTAHTLSKAATGRGVIRGPAGKLVDLGAVVAAPAGLQHVAPKAAAALGLGAKTVMASKLGGAVAAAAKDSQKAIALGKSAALALKTGKLSASVATPLVKRALAVRTAMPKVAPALAARVKLSKAVKKRLVSIAAKAKTGDPDARYTAAVIARTAKMTDEIARAQQAAGGGNPGFVITASGKVRKAPKGKFIQQASLPVIETLYRGASTAPLRGSFSAVSGIRGSRGKALSNDVAKAATITWQQSLLAEGKGVPEAIVDPAWLGTERGKAALSLLQSARVNLRSPWAPPLWDLRAQLEKISGMHDYGPAWGGHDDPGNEYEGPLYPVRYPAADTVGGTPRHGWKGAPGTTAAARDRVKALLELARARHHLRAVLKRGRTTKVGNMSHLADIPGEMTEQSDGIPTAAQHPEIIGCAMPHVGASVMIGGLPWYVFTQRGLRHPVIKRRFLAGLKAMPPKMRRRVISRIRGLHLRERISGAVRNVTPNVGYDLQGYGWAGVSGCSQVAGPLTP